MIFDLPLVYVGIAAFFVATTIATLGHVTMKMHADHLKLATDEKAGGLWKRYKYVCVSVALYVAGGAIDLSVNRLIPFYIRACFAALDIPIYVLFARAILHEVMDAKQTMGVMISVIGCSVAVALSAHPVASKTKADLIDSIFSYKVGVLTAISVPLFFAAVYAVRTAVKSNQEVHDSKRLWLLSCGVFASSYTATWASLLVRTVSELAHYAIFDPVTLLMALGLVLMSVAQLATMADMHALFKSVVSMPFYLICNAAGIVLLSSIVFNEVPAHVYLFGLSMVASFVGIGLIVHKAPEEIEDDPIEDMMDEERQLLTEVHE